ncbi:hypothetical protein [Arthrobacter sp. StoSoilB5]|uniref:hypothetical protein n=1 Tax=Arthrobacter sp. StoSoilB5 TaxID=2830992 RepID=UPI001CC38ADE|nr:hypothetical protein [Arthrobacter sp. StoSoilB5]BCW46796.1 hypothetical protein StoSoilB5_39800 [Arthrobacter sp. StoSoilB5]
MSDASRKVPPIDGRQVLHRSLDVLGHVAHTRNEIGIGSSETYQDQMGRPLWSLKRYPAEPPAALTNNPDEVEKEKP